jgi:hypothetical protein
MTGQLITPDAAVFPGLAAAAKRGVGGLLLELNPGSINMSFRGVSSTIAHPPNNTLFGFTLKPKSGANTARPAIRFLY